MSSLSIIAIGGELLSGLVHESNSHWLQKQLSAYDIQVQESIVIHDHLETIIEAIRHRIQKGHSIMISGGLGPTHDDLTREACATALDSSLVYDEVCWQVTVDFFKQRGKAPNEANRVQAYRPENCSPLTNPTGTAPGFIWKKQKQWLMALPGVPSEFQKMTQLHLLPLLQPSHIQSKRILCHGIGESNLVELINEHEVFPKDFEWGTAARKEGLTLRFPAHSVGDSRFPSIYIKAKELLQPYIISESEAGPLEILVEYLRKNQLTLSCAESCTGGLLSTWLTDRSGSSDYFIGSTIAYQNEIKEDVLKVSKKTLDQHGAVSEACALEMAQGSLNQMQTDLALAITGIAGPNGGTEEKPVGTVCIAAVTRKGQQQSKTFHFPGTRPDIRERSAYAACLLGYTCLNAS